MLANTHQIHPQCLHDSSTHTSVIQNSTQTDLQTDTQADNDKHFPRVGEFFVPCTYLYSLKFGVFGGNYPGFLLYSKFEFT